MFSRHWQLVARSARQCHVSPGAATSNSRNSYRITPLAQAQPAPSPIPAPVPVPVTQTRPFSTTLCSRTAQEDNRIPPLTAAPSSSAVQAESPVKLQGEEPRLSLTFTCTVPDCGTRSTHEFTKRSYQRGIVIVQCPGCQNRHLIADHLGWFKESMDDGKLKTVEDLMRAKGETVRRGRLNVGDDVIEYVPD